MSGSSHDNLKTRSVPVQKRSKERINKILTATADLLSGSQNEAITTTQIAVLADIPVSSVYRYFPNVYSIFGLLFQEVSTLQNEQIISIIEDTKSRPSWRERQLAIMSLIRTAFDEHPYYRALLKAVLARPELKGPKEEMVRTISMALSDRWSEGADGFSGGDPDVVARLTIQIFLAIEAFLVVQEVQNYRDKYFEELALNLECYLANYLEDDA